MHLRSLVPCLLLGMPAMQARGADEPVPFEKLSLEELMEIEVASVSRRPERQAQAPSAIQVVSGNDIRRFGATSIPEALRLASNLHVAQANAREWAISARGFNNKLANKMLVMIDGRTVYTPLFAGMFWDAQDTLLADIDQIEVISGPGGTLWGANAVNGVINILTKHARETQGAYIEGGAGTELTGFGGIRYGGALAENVHYRLYTKYANRDHAATASGDDTADAWDMLQGGYRLDWDTPTSGLLTLQGDIYDSPIDRPESDQDVSMSGGNVLARWSQALDKTSHLQVQVYYDRTNRSIPDSLTEHLDTYDIDLQHTLQLGDHHRAMWGLGYRRTQDDITNPVGLAILPPDASREWYSGFVQDEIAVLRDALYVTLGTKVEHNDYTGFEFQPSGRISVIPDDHNFLWAAVSRAVRTPSRIDADFYAPRDPPHSILQGGPDFKSEVVWAYEAGYRFQPDSWISLSLAGFFNDYDEIRSIEQVSPPAAFPVVFENRLEAQSYGGELSIDAQLQPWWHVHAGYTAMRITFWKDPGSTDTNNGSVEGTDPNHIVTLRTSLDLPGNFSIGLSGRYIGQIDTNDIPAYEELDVRVAWLPYRTLELSVVGQNLLHDQHLEFATGSSRIEIERSVYGKLAWTF